MHAADILAGVHTAFRSPRQAVIMGPGNARSAPGRSSGTGAARGVNSVATPSSSGPAPRRPSTRLIRIRAGHLCRPRSPEATASRKIAERLSDCARAGKTTACGMVSLRRHCPDQVLWGSPFSL